MAVCLPFMGLLMGLIGALGYVPLCFVLPCAMWLKAQRVEMSRLEVGKGLADSSTCKS